MSYTNEGKYDVLQLLRKTNDNASTARVDIVKTIYLV